MTHTGMKSAGHILHPGVFVGTVARQHDMATSVLMNFLGHQGQVATSSLPYGNGCGDVPLPKHARKLGKVSWWSLEVPRNMLMPKQYKYSHAGDREWIMSLNSEGIMLCHFCHLKMTFICSPHEASTCNKLINIRALLICLGNKVMHHILIFYFVFSIYFFNFKNSMMNKLISPPHSCVTFPYKALS